MQFAQAESYLASQGIPQLLAIKGKIKKLIIVSAYGDIEAVRGAYKWLRSHCDGRTPPVMQVFADRAASGFAGNKDAIDLNQLIRKRCAADSGIYLVRGKGASGAGLFHSKAIFIESNLNKKFVTGSMNFTRRGMESNEEVLFIGDTDKHASPKMWSSRIAKQIEGYVTDLLARAEPLSNQVKQSAPADTREFILDGSLLYEVKETAPFNFKLNLPNEVLDVDADELNDLLSGKINDTLPVDRLITERTRELKIEELPPRPDARGLPQWKRLCIQTCYGYWIHNAFRDRLELILNGRKDSREPYFLKLRQIIKEQQQALERQVYLEAEKINDNILRMYPDVAWNAFQDESAFKNRIHDWFSQLNLKLARSHYFNRLIFGFDYAKVPNLAEDDAANVQFEESFLDFLHERIMRSGQRNPRNVIAKVISKNCDAVPEDLESFSKLFREKVALGELSIWISQQGEDPDGDSASEDDDE